MFNECWNCLGCFKIIRDEMILRVVSAPFSWHNLPELRAIFSRVETTDINQTNLQLLWCQDDCQGRYQFPTALFSKSALFKMVVWTIGLRQTEESIAATVGRRYDLCYYYLWQVWFSNLVLACFVFFCRNEISHLIDFTFILSWGRLRHRY